MLRLFVEFTSISRGAGRLHASVLLKKKRVPTAPTAGRTARHREGDRARLPAPGAAGSEGGSGPGRRLSVSPTGIGHKSTLCSATRAPRPPLTPHVFQSSNTPPLHPRKAAWNPGHTPNALRQGVGLCVGGGHGWRTRVQDPALDFRGHGVGCVLGSGAGPRGRTGESSWPPPGLLTFLSPLSPQAAPGQSTGPGGAHPSRLPRVQPLLQGSGAGRREGTGARLP